MAPSRSASFNEYRSVGSPAEPCPLVWIEIKLEDEEGQPVPGERYRIEHKDGSVTEGVLGADGTARLDGIQRGDCKITFPEMDRRAYDRK